MKNLFLLCLVIIISCNPITQGPSREYNQIPNRSEYTASWNKNSEQDMSIYLVKKKTTPFGELTDYMVKYAKHPDTSCVIRKADLPAFQDTHEKIDLYVVAQDSSENKSEPSKTASAVFCVDSTGIMGDTDKNGRFDDLDYNRMEAAVFLGEYRAFWDYNADGVLDSLDLAIINKETE